MFAWVFAAYGIRAIKDRRERNISTNASQRRRRIKMRHLIRSVANIRSRRLSGETLRNEEQIPRGSAETLIEEGQSESEHAGADLRVELRILTLPPRAFVRPQPRSVSL